MAPSTDGDGLALTSRGDGVVLRVRARPRADRDAVLGRHGDALLVATREVPDRGRANEAIRRILAAALSVAPSRVELCSGATGRDKRFQVHGLSGPELLDRLRPFLGTAP